MDMTLRKSRRSVLYHLLLQMAYASFFTLSLAAQMETVEIPQPQMATAVAGVINDPSGAPLSGVTVEDCSPNWKTVLRSTETDDKGRFHFSRKSKQTVYYLKFSRAGFNWVELKLELKKGSPAAITVKMPLGT
jgi:hypothetical protein